MNSLQRFNRRSFIKAAAVASAPFLLPSRVWSAATKPGDKITLGFIGVGIQSRGLMGGFLAKSETQVVAVCDVDTTRRNDAKKRVDDFYAKQKDTSFKGCDAYKDFRELLARKDIDAVVIATPDHWHAYIAIAAANAGKDIYCEKPLCQSIVEAREMVKAVRKNKRVFQTGSMQRSSKEFRVACEFVRNGVLGKIEKVDVGVGGPGKFCDLPEEAAEPGLDWDMWLGPAPVRSYNSVLSPRGIHKHFPLWRAYREYGGGMVTDWGAHHFDIAQWGLGMDESGPVEIFPAARPDADSGVRFRYANGIEVTHQSDKSPGNGVWFHGKSGMIYVNRGKFELTLDGQKKVEGIKDLDTVASTYLTAKSVRLYNSTDHKADFLASIRSRQKPICDVEIGARTVSVCHLVNMAYNHGAVLKWDPKREKFTGGTGKAEWLNVPHRGNWQVG